MKKNRLAAIVLAVAMAIMPSFSALAEYEEADIFITLDGLLKKTEVQPIIAGGYTLVSLREISEFLNAEVDWNASSQTVTVKMGNSYTKMTVGDEIADIDHTDVKMPVAPILVNDRVMVPLRFICEKYKLRVNWDEAKHLVALSSGKQIYSVLEARPEKDLGENGVELTFSKAVEQINNNNSTLQNNKDTFEVLRRTKKELDDYILNYVGPLNNERSKIYTVEEVAEFRKQRTLNNQIKALEITDKLIKESNVLQLQNALTEIQKTDLDIYLLEEKLKLDETNLVNMKLKLELGLETESNIRSLENSIAKDKITLNTLGIRQENNNLTLNKLLGVDASKKVRITDFEDAIPVYQNDVEIFVKEQLKNAPLMSASGTELRINLDNATWVKTSYNEMLLPFLKEQKTIDNEESMVIVEMENNIDKAQRAFDDAQIALESKIRTTYNSIKQLEQSYESLKVDYEIAKDNYEQIVTNYITGYATIFDVQQGQLGLLNAEAALRANRINYRMTVESYKVPYLIQ